MARRRKVSLADLSTQAWAACNPGTGHREMQIRISRQLGGFEPDLRYASDDFLILLELVRTTGACALAARSGARATTPRGSWFAS